MMETETRWRWRPAAAAFVALFALALALDGAVARWVRESGLGHAVKSAWWATIVKEPGEFRLACAIAAVLVATKALDWRRAAFVPVAGVMGLVNAIMKWVVGRHRPYTFRLESIDQAIPWNVLPFRKGEPVDWLMGLPVGKLTSNLGFASGHVAMSFATATALTIFFPRWRWVCFGIASLTALERIAENAHWASDVVAAAALSYFGVHLLWRLAQRWTSGKVSTGETE